MVQFYIRGGVAVLGAGLDDVGVEGSLGEEFGVLDFGRLGFEGGDEFCADDFSFLLRVGNACKFREELFRPVNDAQVDVEVVAEGGDDLLAFVFAKQAVIDEYADELVAYGLVEQGGRYGGIDAAAEAADNGVVADLFVDFFDGFADEVAHFPVAGAAADVDKGNFSE